LETIVMKALAREVAERYQSLDEMHADLVRLVREMAARLQRSDHPALALLQGARDERAVGNVGPALKLAQEALRLSPGHGEALALVAELEREQPQVRTLRLVEEARRLLREGDMDGALERAKKALELSKTDAGAQVVAREAQAEILGKRVEK